MKTFLKQKGYNKYVIILNNLSSHKTKKAINFYQSNNMNIIFNVSYCSYFNCVELAFGVSKNNHIKNYSKILMK